MARTETRSSDPGALRRIRGEEAGEKGRKEEERGGEGRPDPATDYGSTPISPTIGSPRVEELLSPSPRPRPPSGGRPETPLLWTLLAPTEGGEGRRPTPDTSPGPRPRRPDLTARGTPGRGVKAGPVDRVWTEDNPFGDDRRSRPHSAPRPSSLSGRPSRKRPLGGRTDHPTPTPSPSPRRTGGRLETGDTQGGVDSGPR